MSSSQIFVGLGLTFVLAVACQIAAARYRLPSLILLLPVGFVAGNYIEPVDPATTLGAAFAPLVSLAVAIILFDSGLELVFSDLEGHSQRVVRRLLYLGIPVTWVAVAVLSANLLGLSTQAASMLGAILIVSGPTVVLPLLEVARPGRRVSMILEWEGSTIDPLGAIIGAVVFEVIRRHVGLGFGKELGAFSLSMVVGFLGGALGVAVLWFVLNKLKLHGVLATEGIVATVIGVAALCNAVRDDTGLIASVVMGVALANLPGIDLPEDRPFFKTIVQLVIGLLFISISATVADTSLRPILWPTLAMVAVLMLVVRPLIAAATTFGTSLSGGERAFIGWMDPRGIVAASTAASFTAPLVAAGVVGAEKLLPITFLVIVATVAVYGLTATTAVTVLGLGDDEQADLPDEPSMAPPPSDEEE